MKRITLLLGLSAFLFGGCVLDTLADCHNLCSRYADCFDSRTDIVECVERCERRVDSGENDRADRCDSCLNEQDTYLGATLACTVHCAPLLGP